MLACRHLLENKYEYTQLQVKQVVVVYERADNAQFQQMVTSFLSLNNVTQPYVVASALSVALS
ncbi:crossover junction endodeoxyribonuclease RuvC, partial [Clostridioides difficile]|uniref:crossover junction endodeoxyribonuclease RuvC n=1 Tax=Clostridioides difficile TaxID=1496 RepID=UPI0014310E9D|nr:crossover junction endodeoxyribonuclease RuvC [Clostridioides difficile]